MDNFQTKREDMLVPDIHVNTMSSPNTPPESNGIKQSAQISATTNLGQASPMQAAVDTRSSGVPGMNIEPNLASRVNQSNSLPHKLNVKLIVILSVSLLLVGGLAYAWFFTDLKYKLPWFRASEDKLVGMMYDNLAKLDGTDFAVSYKLSIGERDEDVKVDANKISDREAYLRADDLEYQLKYYTKSLMLSCFYGGQNLRAFDGQNCDGSDKAKPQAGAFFCDEEVNVKTDNFKDDFGVDSLSTGSKKWIDLKKAEWEYDGNCLSDPVKKTYSFSLHSTYNDDKITCNEKDCKYNNARLRSTASYSGFNFLLGEYLNELDEYITENFDLQVAFTGSGFSLKEREKDNNQLPNIELGVNASADLGSVSANVNAAAKLIDDFVYYKVDKFPFVDLTQGHENEWIKIGLEDDSFISDMVPDWNEDQVVAIKKFRDLIAKTKDYNVLEFKKTHQYSEKHGVKSPIFEVTLIPENVPNWLEELKKVYEQKKDNATANEPVYDDYYDDSYFEANALTGLQVSKMIDDEPMTEEEKQNMVAQIKKMMTNVKMSVALNPFTGDLMDLTVNFRIIPPVEVKKFANKQFNSTVTVEMWNQNKPTETKIPDKFIEQSEIEREKLGLSKEAYNDVQQADRLNKVRRDLATYYNQHKSFPAKLSEATKLLTDYNTKKEYGYKVVANNYQLSYQMNDLSKEEELDDYSRSYRRNYYTKDMGTNNLTRKKELWDKGLNVADRYSPVAHKYNNSQIFLLNDKNHYDKDVFVAVHQAYIAYKTGSALKSYYSAKKKYPDSLEILFSSEYNYKASYGDPYYIGENLVTGQFANYKVSASGADYSISFDFPLAIGNIDQSIINNRQREILNFIAGSNEYNKSNIDDTVYSMQQDINNINKDDDRDTDGDGFYDGEEVKNGYNPNGSGKLNEIMVHNGGIQYAPITAGDWVKGDSKAIVSLIIYSDADCPFCKNFHETSNQILKDYAGKVKVVYRHFPLAALHPEAPKKAEAIECVGELGGNTKVWLFLDKLFVASKPTLAQLGDTATAVGVDKTKFQTCLDSGKYATKVSTQASGAQTAGAQGTPYSLLIQGINVIPINGAQPIAEIKNKIDSLLK